MNKCFTVLFLFYAAISGICFAVKLPTQTNVVYDACFTKGGKVLVIPDSTDLFLFDADAGELLDQVKHAHRQSILSVDISDDSTMLASGAKDSVVIVWDLIRKVEKYRFKNHDGIILSVCFSKDNKLLASAGSDNKVCVYDMDTGVQLGEYEIECSLITRLVFHPTKNQLIVATLKGGISLIELEKGTIRIFMANKGFVRDVCFDSREMVFTCGDNKNIELWSLNGRNLGSPISEMKNPIHSWITAVDMLEGGQTLIYGGLNGRVGVQTPFALYEMRVKASVLRIKQRHMNNGQIGVCIVTKGDGAHLVTGSDLKLITYK